jgi:hypothetical protein
MTKQTIRQASGTETRLHQEFGTARKERLQTRVHTSQHMQSLTATEI